MTIIVSEILLVVTLFFANGVFAMSEMALVSARKSRLKQFAEAGNPGAAAALRLVASPDRFLPTVQIGITLIGLLAGAFSGATLAAELAAALKSLPGFAPYAEALSVGVVVVALTFLSVIIGELAPKRIALAAPEIIACRLARPVEWLGRLAQPVVHLFSATTGLVLRMFRIKPGKMAGVSDDDVRMLLLEGCETGVFRQDEPRMVESILAFDHRPLREIMTPLAKLAFVGLDDPPEALWHKIVASGHSIYPVHGEQHDHIVGLVTVKSVYAKLAGGTPVRVRDLLTRPLFVAPDDPVLTVLNRFKHSGMHVAVVRTVDGRAVGLVTLVDILEAIVGDIPSLEDRLRPEVMPRGDGSWLADGQYDLGKLAELLGVSIPPPATDSGATLASFVGYQLHGHPREGDSFTTAGLRFEVIDMDRTSVDKILISCESENNAHHPAETIKP
ncbi:MAG: hemolysin family protein [Verrucomicrobia bacterium]|nr:hemolysin family protein [Verrucomicrobiota bacterium]